MLHILAGIGLHCLRDHGLQRCLARDAHELDIRGSLTRTVQRVNIGAEFGFLFFVGRATGIGLEGQAGQHIGSGLGQLSIHNIRVMHLFHNRIGLEDGIRLSGMIERLGKS